mmetsp:Transcript_14512/g.36120  ORF Transcript_14512/g.36120 Transcript_14512/m.36120 type:complete len:249 (-) Transcript_14512:196-942(-)
MEQDPQRAREAARAGLGGLARYPRPLARLAPHARLLPAHLEAPEPLRRDLLLLRPQGGVEGHQLLGTCLAPLAGVGRGPPAHKLEQRCALGGPGVQQRVAGDLVPEVQGGALGICHGPRDFGRSGHVCGRILACGCLVRRGLVVHHGVCATCHVCDEGHHGLGVRWACAGDVCDVAAREVHRRTVSSDVWVVRDLELCTQLDLLCTVHPAHKHKGTPLLCQLLEKGCNLFKLWSKMPAMRTPAGIHFY